VLFNILLVEAVRRGDAGSVGVIVGAVPVVLVIAGPLLERERLRPALLLAAAVVAAGAALVQGAGGTLPPGALALSLGVLACEACFGLLARPLIPAFGPAGVSTWIVLLAVPMLVAIGLAADGTALLAVPTAREGLALGYMAVLVTAGGFLAWYGAIARLGVERAGLFSGVLPVTALFTGAALGHAAITPGRIAGIAVVAAGITAGLLASRGREPAAPGGARLAGLDDAAAQRVELGELRVDPVERGVEPPALGLAGGAPGVVGGERVDDVVEREADRLELAREPDALDRLRRVVAVARRLARRRGQHAHPLVEADGVDAHA